MSNDKAIYSESQRTIILFALAAVCLIPGLVGAGSSTREGRTPIGVSLLDWEHDWSVWKVVMFLITVAFLWWASYRVVFHRLINARRGEPPWPRDVFARSIATFLTVSVVAFVFWFALASRALRSDSVRISFKFPGPAGSFLNDNWLWIALLNVALFGHVIVYYLLKHRPHSTSER
jgi:hypothetical protein